MPSGDARHPKRSRRRPQRIADAEAQPGTAAKSVDILVARTTDWLTEVGAWIFGGLLALNLVLIASLLDVGPVDTAILISICALGCALSVNVVGICLNRLVKDIKYVEIAERLPILQEVRDAESSEIEALYPPPEEQETLRRKRSTRALWWSSGFQALSGTLTGIALVAALWHVAWWIGTAALVTGAVSAALVTAVFLSVKPAGSEASRDFAQRYAERVEHRTQQELRREQQEAERREAERREAERRGRRAA